MTAADFSEYFKKLSHAELLAILEEPGKYRPDAIIAAKEELGTRNLSEYQLSQAGEVIHPSKSIAKSLATETIGPHGHNKLSVNKTINAIAIATGLLIIAGIISNREWIWFMIEDFGEMQLTSIFFLLPLVIGITAVILFLKKKAFGWHLMIFTVCLYSAFVLLMISDLVFLISNSDNINAAFQLDQIVNYLGALILPFVLYKLRALPITAAFGINKYKRDRTVYLSISFVIIIIIAIIL